jgi:uncharacterized membrane protein YccC
MGALAYATFAGLDGAFGHAAIWARLLQVGAAIAIAFAAYYASCKLLRVRELDQAISALLTG